MSQILTDHGLLPLPSLRLIVPPLQLVSAALWEIVKQGAVMYYGLLEEFVSTVLETVPELLTDTERVQLVMGLRAKVVLELCLNDDFASPQAIQPHLSRINTHITNQDGETTSSEVKASVTNFLKLVHTLVKDQCQRDIFYQKVYPTVFGPQYDSALQALMRKFLFNLQRLLPVPNLEQTSLWLSLSPSILKECVDFMTQPEPLNTLIQHHKHHGHKVPRALSSCADECILSSLSYHLPNSDDGETLGSDSTKEKEENCEEIKSKPMRIVEGEQHVDDLPEDRGASVEVILPPFDERDSNDGDHMDKKMSRRLKTGGRTSSKTFKCLVCGQDFGSPSKLKKHKITQSGCSTNTMSRPDSASQSSFFKKINLHPKPKACVESELSSRASAATLKSSLTNYEQLHDDSSLVCHVCSKVFTYPKNFDKHQRTCVVSSKRQAEPADMTKESFPIETDNVVPQESIASVSPQEQPCKRSSRVKQCSTCGKVFTCSADLTRHMRCHTEQSPYLCTYCGIEFDSYEDCETHQEGACRVSNQRSRDNSSSNSSKRNQEDVPTIPDASANSQAKSPLTCQECGQGFTYYKSFEKHQGRCSKGAPRRKKQINANHLVISACDFPPADNTNAKASIETGGSDEAKTPTSSDGTQSKSGAIKCTMCEKNFPEIVLMKRHYSKSHKVRGSYPCPVCKRTFVRLCELVRHQQNKKLYQCAACKKCYTKPGLLDDHEKVHTASAAPRACETCGKSFKSLAYLILHQSKHRERQPSVCTYCGKQFSTKDCLRAHMVRHTGGYPCPVCGKKFYQKTYLKWHLYKHTGQEPYLCDTCGKGWPSAAQLKMHMVQHTEARPFKCEDCGICYKRGSHLMAHRRAKHIGLRPFACEVCGKAFRLNNELRKHMMVHTGERPFTCPRCDKTFTRKSRLREHREKACV
ncbi:zinc finger protein 665-like [Anoplopoma fimbria]|uniref:zinc finger protein 665-like n=1 Tax=Anoplopoma fimbria TaxID=229290 RepID=UPI0023EBDFD7|nr:zinc finger protein 665-like [Anoplopoma fimbria]